MNPQTAHLLVFHQAALGDWVLTFSLWRSLLQQGHTLTLIAHASHARLAQRVLESQGFASPGQLHILPIEHPLVHQLWTGEDCTRWTKPKGVSWADVTHVISYVNFPPDAVRVVERLWPHATFHPMHPRPDRQVAQAPMHMCERLAAQLKQRGIVVELVQPRWLHAARGPLLIHPGSGGLHKCWPSERFTTWFQWLDTQALDYRVLLGEAESERWPASVVQHWQHEHHALVLHTLDELLEWMRQACGYVGHDAGPTHLAAQMGLPTLALFGPTDPQVWRPQGPAVRVLAPPVPAAMTWLSVDEFIRCFVDWRRL